MLSYDHITNNITNVFSTSYSDMLLTKVSTFCDLGVTYTSNFSFNTHINIIINKSFKMLGFLKRNSTHFNKLKTFLTLYNHLIRSNLEYCAVVWSPTTASCINDIERVQQFLLLFYYIMLYFFVKGAWTTFCTL